MVNVESYVALTCKLAVAIYKSLPYARGWGTMADAKQQALLLLCEIAREKAFDAERGCFSTYLGIRLRQQLVRAIRDGTLIRTPTNSYLDERYREIHENANRTALNYNADRHIGAEGRGHEDVALDVKWALGRLSRSHREMLEEYYFEGIQQAEMAKRRGIPVFTLGERFRKAQEAIAKVLVSYRGAAA